MKPIPIPSCFRPIPPPPQTIPINNPSLPLEINGFRPPEVGKIPLGYSNKKNLTPNPNRPPANIAASAPNQPRSKINPPSPRSVDSASLETKKRKPNAAASAERKNPNSFCAFWSAPPPPKASSVVQSLKKSIPSFRFSLQNSYFIQSSHDSKDGERRRGLSLLLLRRIKVRKRWRRRKKKGEVSDKISARCEANWIAATKDTTQTEKKVSCVSLAKEKGGGSLSEIGRWCCNVFKSVLKGSDNYYGDSVRILSNQSFPVVHDSKLKVEGKDRIRGFRVRGMIAEAPSLISVSSKEKDKVLKRRRGCRVFGAIGGEGYGGVWVLSVQFKLEKEAQKLVQKGFS